MSFQDSPVVLSRYDPSGQCVANVTTALDKQRISVESASASGNELDSEIFYYLDNSRLRVSALEWSQLVSVDTPCIIIGLNNGEIQVYSPLSNEVIHTFSTGSSYEIKDLTIQSETLWCVDGNDQIYQFSLTDFKLIKQFKIEGCTQLNKLSVVTGKKDQLLLASHSVFLVDVVEKKILKTYPGHVSPVCILTMLSNEFFLTGAEHDRFLNVYGIETGAVKAVLVAQSNVMQLSHFGQDVVSVTTENGTIEIFEDPLIAQTNKKRNKISKQFSKTIKLLSEKKSTIPAYNVFINNDTICFGWLQNAVVPYFAHLTWRTLPTEFVHEIPLNYGKGGKKDHSLFGKDAASVTTYSENNARVSSGDNFRHVNDAIKKFENDLEESEKTGETEVTEAFADKLESLTAQRLSGKKSKTSGIKGAIAGTLTVVLSQALQSNDHSLLETVLNNRDERVIKNTILRLKPTLAVILLERLAERIARQTHRQDPLSVWVKWCLVIHGGYLVTIPNLMSTLSSLHSTMKRRSDLLPRLMTLETKLDYALNLVELKQKTTEELEEEELAYDSVAEEEVEYNEELDDAGLIDDGEEDSSEDEEDEMDEISDQSDGHSVENDEEQHEEEHNYSDVEM